MYTLAPSVSVDKHKYTSLEELFEDTLQNEQAVTKSIDDLVDLCLKERDHSTHNFLQWYVAEQSFRATLDLFKIIGVDGKGLYHIDKKIGSKING